MNKLKTTQYPDINELLDELISQIKLILGDKLVGIYLYGSLVWGDFDYHFSDIDLLAAVTSDINEKDANNLKKMHDDFAVKHKQWNDRIETQYLSLVALKTFKTKKSNAGTISPGEPFHIIEVGKHWLMNWYMVREKGMTLLGPDPKTIIEPISKEEFIQSVKEHAMSWGEWVNDMHSKGAQAYAVLTLCRALYAFKHGEQVSKKQAATWAEKELPEWATFISHALKWREEKYNYEADSENFLKTKQFVDYVRNKILE
jgi:predicted nucleotidyltransferase